MLLPLWYHYFKMFVLFRHFQLVVFLFNFLFFVLFSIILLHHSSFFYFFLIVLFTVNCAKLIPLPELFPSYRSVPPPVFFLSFCQFIFLIVLDFLFIFLFIFFVFSICFLFYLTVRSPFFVLIYFHFCPPNWCFNFKNIFFLSGLIFSSSSFSSSWFFSLLELPENKKEKQYSFIFSFFLVFIDFVIIRFFQPPVLFVLSASWFFVLFLISNLSFHLCIILLFVFSTYLSCFVSICSRYFFWFFSHLFAVLFVFFSFLFSCIRIKY